MTDSTLPLSYRKQFLKGFGYQPSNDDKYQNVRPVDNLLIEYMLRQEVKWSTTMADRTFTVTQHQGKFVLTNNKINKHDLF